MSVISVDAVTVHAPIPPQKQVESGAGWKLARQATLVVVTDDEGHRGMASTSGPYDAAVVHGLIDAVRPLLVGTDAPNTRRAWWRLWSGHLLRNAGRSGVAIAVQSALDTALWDLKARRLGVPVFDLLGGLSHPLGARAYASSLYWGLTPEVSVGQVQGLVEDGFSAVKFKVGRTPDIDVARVEAVRNEFPELTILVDANQTCDRRTALRLLERWDELDVLWFEEPLDLLDFEGHALLRARSRQCLIAAGENYYTGDDVERALNAGAVDVVQADISRAGGVTEFQRIQALVETHHARWHPHTFNDAATVAVNLHGVLAHIGEPLFEWDITYNPLMTMPGAPVLEDGVVQVPQPTWPGFRPRRRPRLGQGLSMGWLRCHRGGLLERE